MKIKAGENLVETIVLAYSAMRSVLLIGRTGVGKSEVIEQAARHLGISYICVDLSLMEAPDLTGLPIIVNGRTAYAAPTILPTGGRGLLVFEELNRAPRYTQAPCLQLITARRLNDYILPAGWLPIAAINPDAADEGYHVEEMDAALLARFSQIEVVPDVRNWLAWAKQNDVHWAVCAYVSRTPDVFKAQRSNPRAWKYVSDVLQAHEQEPSTTTALTALIDGQVGPEHARAFLRTYEMGATAALPEVDRLLRSYPRVRKQVLAVVKAGDTSSLNSLAHQILIYLQDPTQQAAVCADGKCMGNLFALLGDLPPDIRKRIVKHHKWLKEECEK